MLAADLAHLKEELKQILPEEGISTVIKAIKSHIPSDAPKFNAILQMEARLNEANLKKIKGILSEEQLQVQYNQLRDDILDFIDGLRPEDFSKEAAKKAKTGSVLYKVPREMELQQRCKCIVRLAYEESIIIQDIELTSDTSLQSIRISEAMEVAMLDPEGGKNFKISSISSPEQFLDEDEFSEWVFYVTPLTTGAHPIILKISVIEMRAGKERKKEIVLEELVTIVTQPVEEDDNMDFKKAGYSFAMAGMTPSGDSDGDGGSSSGSSSGSTVSKTSAAFKKYSMVLGAFTVLLMASWAMGGLTFVSWQEALWKDTIEKYEGFMLKYPDSKYLPLARQHRDLKVAVKDNSDTLLVDFILDNPKSELVKDAVQEFIKRSDDDLQERIKERAVVRERRKRGLSDKPEKVPEETEIFDTSIRDSLALAARRDSIENDSIIQAFLRDSVESQLEKVKEIESTTMSTRESTNVPSSLPETKPEKLPEKKKKDLDALSWLDLNMAYIQGGTFTMGCDRGQNGCPEFSSPKRQVKVKDFRLCKYEVTQALWEEVMGSNPSNDDVKWCKQCPVEGVSWRDVQRFIRKLNRKAGRNYRLPSEAEWEYAAKGGVKATGTVYPGSGNPKEVAWYSDNIPNKTQQPIGKKKPNELGLYDMSGNVFEWCEDTWNPNYEDAPKNAKPWVNNDSKFHRIVRGGSWMDADPEYLRADFRDMFTDSLRNHIIGFRLAADK